MFRRHCYPFCSFLLPASVMSDDGHLLPARLVEYDRRTDLHSTDVHRRSDALGFLCLNWTEIKNYVVTLQCWIVVKVHMQYDRKLRVDTLRGSGCYRTSCIWWTFFKMSKHLHLLVLLHQTYITSHIKRARQCGLLKTLVRCIMGSVGSSQHDFTLSFF